MTRDEKYFNSLTPGIWHQVKNIPQNIGFAGLINAVRDQILLPENKIIMGHYYSTFRIEKVHIANNYQDDSNQKTA